MAYLDLSHLGSHRLHDACASVYNLRDLTEQQKRDGVVCGYLPANCFLLNIRLYRPDTNESWAYPNDVVVDGRRAGGSANKVLSDRPTVEYSGGGTGGAQVLICAYYIDLRNDNGRCTILKDKVIASDGTVAVRVRS